MQTNPLTIDNVGKRNIFNFLIRMNPILVMIVDDDSDDSALLKEIVTEIHPETQCMIASDGLEALSILNFSPRLPDFIFLDINMPHMNGKEYLKRIKSNERLKHIQVIIYSTTRHISDIEETRQLGASFFMTKSVMISQIRSSLKAVFTQDVSKKQENAMIILE